MDTELKQRKKAVGNRKRTKPGAGVKPEEVTSVLQIPVIFSLVANLADSTCVVCIYVPNSCIV